MSAKRFGRLQKATAILPLALLSAAWTASLAGVGPTTVSATTSQEGESLPDGTSVPTDAIEAPASVTAGSGLGGAVDGNAAQIIATSSTNGIPSAALAAYMRAETVINSADKACRLPWQLVAAIGRVESNHGRYGGNTLTDDGVATPGIFGVPLNGKKNTAVIRDTDAGLYDQDQAFDRAIGPMQFIPSTWSVVGVDADGDGQRNPQDIDDAALASAVYLCSGNDDLGTLGGQRASVYRYNHSTAYVDLVLSIMDAYMSGDYTSVPNSTSSAGRIVPDPGYSGGQGSSGGQGGKLNDGGGKAGGPTPAPPTPTEPAAPEPSDNGGGNAGGGGNGGGGIPTQVPSPSLPPVTIPPLPSTSVPPVDQVLTLAQALVQCALDGLVDNPLVNNDRFDQCVKNYTT
ncbi:lytic transglycosylase domain-containing protein [Nocardioides sp. cx-169]|uniref:lytic transglycosylase domain-containing protein n=1 Tax=Nocardioides sp. cx-169 TaxID=2899080 RepID=UPI0022AC0617|nr:lytic murein transglycosylase [Nocardioides sp. cx-169]